MEFIKFYGIIDSFCCFAVSKSRIVLRDRQIKPELNISSKDASGIATTNEEARIN
jgi:hypothetical protein